MEKDRGSRWSPEELVSERQFDAPQRLHTVLWVSFVEYILGE